MTEDESKMNASDAEKSLLDSRAEQYDSGQAKAEKWEEVKARLVSDSRNI